MRSSVSAFGDALIAGREVARRNKDKALRDSIFFKLVERE
jgi:hypothetical protein